MPRGRPKKSAEVEILPPEENDQPKIREIKHKTEWIEAVPVEETSEEEGEDFDDDSTEDRPRRKTKNAREELRKKLRAQGVAPSTNLRLYIEKYLHSDSNTGGSYAETEFCTKYQTTEEHILNKDYIDVAKRWGAGKYRITIRMQNKIVDAFDERISATPTGPVIQHINPADPNSPQVIVQQNGDGQQQQPYQPMTMRDIMKAQKEAFKEQLEMAKLMREAYGFTPEAPTTPKSEEEVLTTAILKQPEVIENVVGSVLKRFGGKGGSGDDEPSLTAAFMETVKSGQLANSIDAVFRGIHGLVNMILPQRGQNDGQAQVGTAPMQDTQQVQDRQRQNDQGISNAHTQGQAALPADTGGQENTSVGQPPATPEQHALARLIENCQRRVPVQVAFQQLINYADAVNEQAPDYSIDGYIDMLGSAPTEAVIEFVKTLPGGDQIAALPHAKEWTEQLQKLIRESQEGDEE